MLKFLFDKQVYTPGSTVKGKLIVTVEKKVCIEHIEVTAVGKSLINLSDDPFVSPSTEKYLDVAFNLWQKDSSVKDDGLEPGNHEFAFEFPLPPNVPSSFRDMKGRIEYTIRAWMPSSSRFGRDYGLTVAIPVQRKVILPSSSLHDPMYAERDVAGGLFKFSGRIKLTAELPRSGYLLGEVIPLSGHILNTSTSSVRLCAYLIEHVAYTNPKCLQAKRVATYSRTMAHIGQFACLSRAQNVQWTCDNLHIPDDFPPSGATEGCTFFAVKYFVKLCMLGSGTAKNTAITFNISIGNDLGIPQLEAAMPTLNQEAEWYEQTVDINQLADSSPTFYLGGANGVDPFTTESYSESVDLPVSPPLTPITPQPRRTSVTVTNDDPLMQPPSYDELFPITTQGTNDTTDEQ